MIVVSAWASTSPTAGDAIGKGSADYGIEGQRGVLLPLKTWPAPRRHGSFIRPRMTPGASTPGPVTEGYRLGGLPHPRARTRLVILNERRA